jgi:hypothetical protein
MEKSNLTPADVNTSNNGNSPVSPLQKAVIAQTSKKAQRLLEKSKSNAKEAKKAGTSKPSAKKVTNKKAEPKEKKAPKVTIASKLDEIVKAGGKWEDLVKKAQKASNDMGGTLHFTVGTLKAHIRFRTVTQKEKNPNYLGNKKVTNDGILETTKKVKKAA